MRLAPRPASTRSPTSSSEPCASARANKAVFVPSGTKTALDPSHRLLKFQRELVDRAGRRARGEVVLVVRVTPERAFGDELEAGRLDLAAQHRFIDAMQALADRNVGAGRGGVIGDHQNTTGLERREQGAIHLGAV